MNHCMEDSNRQAPCNSCRCPSCCRAREQSIPVRLRNLAFRQAKEPWKVSASSALIHRALSTYIAGHIGLAEMQIDLIDALTAGMDEQHAMLVNFASKSFKPLIIETESPP